MGEADVQQALERLARLLDEKEIAHAVIDAMALNEWGYRRVTVDVDVLLTAEGLKTLKDEALGRGYVEKFPGSRGLRDPGSGVNIDALPREMADSLDVSVRAKYAELWQAAQARERE